jgi:PAS domain-containing protein
LKSLVVQNQSKILQLVEDPLKRHLVEDIHREVIDILPSKTEFAILSSQGYMVISRLNSKLNNDRLLALKNTMRNILVTTTMVYSHKESEQKYFEILKPIRFEETYVGFWTRIPFKELNHYLSQLPVNGFYYVLEDDEGNPRVLLEGLDQNISPQLEDQVLSSEPLNKLSWKLNAVVDENAREQFVSDLKYLLGLIFLVGTFFCLLFLALYQYTQRVIRKQRLEAEQDALFNAAPTVLIEKSIDDKMVVKYASPNALSLLNIESQQLIDQAFAGFIYAKDVETVQQQLRDALEKGQSDLEFVYRINDAQTQYKWVYEYTHIQYSSAGKPQSLRGYMTSIHAQKTAEQNAVDLIQALPEAIFVTNAAGQIVDLNPAASVMVGQELNTLKEKSFVQLLPEPNQLGYSRLLSRLVKKMFLIHKLNSSPHQL